MRKLIIYFSCFIAVLLAAYVGYRGYRVWKQKHGLEMARSFLAKSDRRSALLSLQQVLRVNPVNLQANRLMAQLAVAEGSSAALVYWGRVVTWNPKSTDDRLGFAQAALLFHNYAFATNALDGVDAAGKQTAAYQNLAGAVSVAANDLPGAELHFLEAARLEPTNETPQMNLAVVLLHGSNALAKAQARTSLERIATDSNAPVLRCQALRELVNDAMQNKQTQAAEAFSQELVDQTNSQFTDRLARLDVLTGTGSTGFKPALAAFQHEAANDPKKIYDLATWQLTHHDAAGALAWLQTLPKATANCQAALLLSAECRTTTGDWPGLQATLEKQKWSELEFLRHAFLVRALREQNLTSAATGEWEQALMAANGQKQSLFMLLNLATEWNLSSEAQNILWTFVNQHPEEKWAFDVLSRTLSAGGETRSLMKLFNQQSQRVPTDLPAKNNVAMLALLLDAQELKPYDLAQEVYQKSPTNSAYASTYAFSLYLKKKNPEALAVMEKLTPQQLEDPSLSGYYGLILKANGMNTKARTYLDLSARAKLLPEERKLMDAATGG